MVTTRYRAPTVAVTRPNSVLVGVVLGASNMAWQRYLMRRAPMVTYAPMRAHGRGDLAEQRAGWGGVGRVEHGVAALPHQARADGHHSLLRAYGRGDSSEQRAG